MKLKNYPILFTIIWGGKQTGNRKNEVPRSKMRGIKTELRRSRTCLRPKKPKRNSPFLPSLKQAEWYSCEGELCRFRLHNPNPKSNSCQNFKWIAANKNVVPRKSSQSTQSTTSPTFKIIHYSSFDPLLSLQDQKPSKLIFKAD